MNKMLKATSHIIVIVVLLINSTNLIARQTQVLNQQSQTEQVIITTELGDIILAIDTINAPVTSTNFLRYIDENRLQQASFYRTVRLDNQPNNQVKIEVIQGGLGFDDYPQQLPAIFHETTEKTGILHKNGTISMARLAPGTANSEFFICINAQPELDFGGKRNPDGQGFAAFGQVITGMDVVKKIQAQANTAQMLNKPVRILNVARTKSVTKPN